VAEKIRNEASLRQRARSELRSVSRVSQDSGQDYRKKQPRDEHHAAAGLVTSVLLEYDGEKDNGKRQEMAKARGGRCVGLEQSLGTTACGDHAYHRTYAVYKQRR
jgi:hypothetical protein